MGNPFVYSANDPYRTFEMADRLIADAIDWSKVDDITLDAYYSDIIPACAVVNKCLDCVSIKDALEYARKVFRAYQLELNLHGKCSGGGARYGRDLCVSMGA